MQLVFKGPKLLVLFLVKSNCDYWKGRCNFFCAFLPADTFSLWPPIHVWFMSRMGRMHGRLGNFGGREENLPYFPLVARSIDWVVGWFRKYTPTYIHACIPTLHALVFVKEYVGKCAHNVLCKMYEYYLNIYFLTGHHPSMPVCVLDISSSSSFRFLHSMKLRAKGGWESMHSKATSPPLFFG